MERTSSSKPSESQEAFRSVRERGSSSQSVVIRYPLLFLRVVQQVRDVVDQYRRWNGFVENGNARGIHFGEPVRRRLPGDEERGQRGARLAQRLDRLQP